jgi:hypothetical protein
MVGSFDTLHDPDRLSSFLGRVTKPYILLDANEQGLGLWQF